jgi:hypothetical protein
MISNGNGDNQLLAVLDDVLSCVQHDVERVRELLHHEMHGLMPVIWEACFMAAGWGGRDLVLGEVAALLVPRKEVGLGNWSSCTGMSGMIIVRGMCLGVWRLAERCQDLALHAYLFSQTNQAMLNNIPANVSF